LPYKRLLSVLDVSPWGTPHSNLRRLAEILPAVRVTHRQGELADLIAAIDRGLPPAVFVWTGELTSYWTSAVYHAVVIVGYDDQQFYLNDPAHDFAPQVVSQQEFDLAWLAHDTYFAVIEPAPP
jgi:ABC-type bacteriocin/lantibiotic exporter with double-glycine peptidase domain